MRAKNQPLPDKLPPHTSSITFELKQKFTNHSHVSKNQKLIGVDLGGTNVRAGLVQNGKIIALNKRPISSHARQEIVLEEVCQTIEAVFQPDVCGIGIGVPSLVDAGKKIVYSVANIPSWRKVPLKKILEKRFGVPVFVNN